MTFKRSGRIQAIGFRNPFCSARFRMLSIVILKSFQGNAIARDSAGAALPSGKMAHRRAPLDRSSVLCVGNSRFAFPRSLEIFFPFQPPPCVKQSRVTGVNWSRDTLVWIVFLIASVSDRTAFICTCFFCSCPTVGEQITAK